MVYNIVASALCLERQAKIIPVITATFHDALSHRSLRTFPTPHLGESPGAWHDGMALKFTALCCYKETTTMN